MPLVVGVRFKKLGKVYYFDPAGHDDLEPGAYVIVDTARGREFGEVVLARREVEKSELVAPLKPVVRRATEDDRLQALQNDADARAAIATCQDKIEKHKLEMDLVDVEYTFDRQKIIFYFTAEGRVDFRGLVRDLASVFRTRVELRQIGVRDEAKMIGGIGPCGREICCAVFLQGFAPVSIRMAKQQDLALNPAKISGLCGRLMCCLRFESEHYRDSRRAARQQGGGDASK